VEIFSGRLSRNGDRVVVRDIKPGTGITLQLPSVDGVIVRIVVLDEAGSLALWKGMWQGRERVFLTHANLVLNGDSLRLTSSDPAELTVGVCPPPAVVKAEGKTLVGQSDGVFNRFTPEAPRAVAFQAEFESVHSAGPPRAILFGKIDNPVAEAPVDADFAQAAVWRIELPNNLDLGKDPILRLHYVGDVARVMLDGKLVTDDFYNGCPFDIGLRRHAPEIFSGQLHVAILPLRKDAQIYIAKEARPDFSEAESVVALKRVEIIPRYYVQLDK
jgi:hypothetical protein